MMPPATFLQRWSERFARLDLFGKLTVSLLGAAGVLGGVVFLVIGLVTRHLVVAHGQDMHVLSFLFPIFAVIGLLVIAGVIVFARVTARFLTQPLQEVVAAAEEIASSGRPTTHLVVRSHDEFGRLAAAFNTMVDRLAESYAGLEQHVAERTREYEESQHEAQRASNLLREAVQSIAQGFTIYDENDCLVLCNEAYLRLYETSRDLIVPGASFEEIIRKGAERGQYEAAIGRVDAWVRERVRQHQNARGEVIEQALGDGRWLMIVEYRTPSGYIVGNRIDITALKRTEAALRQREQALRDHAEQLNAIFDLSPDGFVSFDGERRVKYATPAFLRLTGFTEGEIIGLDEASFSVQLARACVEQARFPGFAALRSRQKLGAGRTAEGEGAGRQLIELAGAGKRVLEVGLRESQAETVSQILYCRDVTHETEVDRLKSEFLSTAAHELRTPMASIFGFTELLMSQDFDAESRREFLATIYRQAELMISIINELLDLARIEARRGKDFLFECVDAVDLVKEVVAGFKVPADRMPPQVAASPTPCCVRADRNKLMQAIGNVLSNAYKYSPAGGEVTFEFLPVQDASPDAAPRIGIRIRDQGIGMTQAQVARVCQRFYRADTSGKIPGTGLGMSIVDEIVQLHGGELAIKSKPGEGTTVTLWLPAAQDVPGVRDA